MLAPYEAMLASHDAMLGLCWAHTTPCWTHIGPIWAHVEPILTVKGPMLSLCRTIFNTFQSRLEKLTSFTPFPTAGHFLNITDSWQNTIKNYFDNQHWYIICAKNLHFSMFLVHIFRVFYMFCNNPNELQPWTIFATRTAFMPLFIMLGAVWVHFGPMFAPYDSMLGLCWPHMKPCWAHVDPIWDHIGPIFGLCWPHVDPFSASSWF